MTQLGELRDAYPRFQEAGVKLYAVSYDDASALAAFAEASRIPFPLLSDAGSRVIREYGILSTEIGPDEVPFYGIPFPGTYVVDESGVVVDKFFPRHIANRESADAVLDSALGEVRLHADEPQAAGSDTDIRITVALHGGGGVLKSGVKRSLVVRFELPDGMHLYGEPVPEGMVATSVTVSGPEGLVVGDVIAPPTTPLRLEAIGADLHVWSGTVDLVVPVFANSHLIDIHAPGDAASIDVDVELRYQACTDEACLIPRTERLRLHVPIGVIDVPDLGALNVSGQRVTSMNSAEHFIRLAERLR